MKVIAIRRQVLVNAKNASASTPPRATFSGTIVNLEIRPKIKLIPPTRILIYIIAFISPSSFLG